MADTRGFDDNPIAVGPHEFYPRHRLRRGECAVCVLPEDAHGERMGYAPGRPLPYYSWRWRFFADDKYRYSLPQRLLDWWRKRREVRG